uniref:TIR domain-containing protein n=1 Tax=Astyanax mexicanus TaxID=7994 RepID=A0A8B9HAG5_ASTMX
MVIVTFVYTYKNSRDSEMHKLQEIPAGHVFPLECTLDDMKIRWGSEKQQELDMESLPAGMKIINQALWFLPAQPSHSGNYYCSSCKEHNAMANFSVAVTNRTSSPKTIHLSRDRNGFLNCKSNYMTKIFQLDPHSHVSWIKVCIVHEIHCWASLAKMKFSVIKYILYIYFELVSFFRAVCKNKHFSSFFEFFLPADGKLYDGYVSYSHGNYKSMSFALKILPEILEDHLGYKLFISGRDELPGGAVHDVIADAVKKCRRLIIVLGSRSSTEHLSLNNNERECYPPLSDPTQTTNLNLDPYEWSVGLYDALVKGGLKIILVQVGGEVDEAQLPESLRYIRRTQGILRWKQDYITKPSGRFWKQLRYRMPLVQKVKLNAVV